MPLLRKSSFSLCLLFALSAAQGVPRAFFSPQVSRAQRAPSPSAARILLLPRRAAAGERATLAVLDVNGRLAPGVSVTFSNGTQVTTDATGRAAFLAPSTPGAVSAAIAGRPGRVPMTIVPSATAVAAGDASPPITVRAIPQFAALTDRFEIGGSGFCGDADANHIAIGGQLALVLAASSSSLVVLPPENRGAGPAAVTLACGDRAFAPFSITFVSLDLVASSSPLAPGERRDLLVRVHGTAERIPLEARNYAPQIAELTGGNPMRLSSAGGADNSARFELLGRSRGSFLISIRLVPPYIRPHL